MDSFWRSFDQVLGKFPDISGVFGRHLLTHPRGVQKGDKRESEGGGRQRVCFNLAGRFPSKLKGACLVFYEIFIISLVLCVKARRAFLHLFL